MTNYKWTIIATWHDFGQEVVDVVAPTPHEAKAKGEDYFTEMNDPGWEITGVVEGQAVAAHLTVQEKCSWAAESMYSYTDRNNMLNSVEWETMGDDALVAYHDSNCQSTDCPKER